MPTDISDRLKIAQQLAFLRSGGGRKGTGQGIAELITALGGGLETAGKGFESGSEALKKVFEAQKLKRESTPVFSMFDVTGKPRETPEETQAVLDRVFQGADAETPDERINRLGEQIEAKRLQLSAEQKPEFTTGEFKDVAAGKLSLAKPAKTTRDLVQKVATKQDSINSGGLINEGQVTTLGELDDATALFRSRTVAQGRVEAGKEGFLTAPDAASLGVPFGTTKREAAGKIPLTPDDQKKLKQIGVAKTLLKQVESLSGKVNTFEAGKLGVERGIEGTKRFLGAKLQTNEDAALMEAQSAKLAVLMRSLGEVGVLTDKDIGRGEELIPKITDTKTIAKRKLAGMDKFFKASETIIRNPGLTFEKAVIKSVLDDPGTSDTAKKSVQVLIEKGMSEGEIVTLILGQ